MMMHTHTAPVSSIKAPEHCNADERLQHLESVYRDPSNLSGIENVTLTQQQAAAGGFP